MGGSPQTGVNERATYASLLRTRGVSALFGISLTTVIATSLQILALSVAVFQQTGSALWSTIAFAAGFLPQLVGGTLLTSLADRWPPRALLASGSVARAASAFVIAFGGLPPAASIAVVAVVAVWQPVPMAAQSTLLTRLVTGERYVLGRSVLGLISSGAQLLGLAAGGAAVQLLGATAAFAVAGLVSLLGLLPLLAIPRTSGAPGTAHRWRPAETWVGNGRLLRDPAVRRILVAWWLGPALLVGAEALVVPYVGEQRTAGMPAGLLLAAFPAGAAVGDLVVGRFLPDEVRRRSVPWLFALVGAPLLPLAWHPGLAVAWTCFALASVGMAYQLGGQQAFLAAVPETQRGLAFGLFSTGLMGGQGVGPVIAGIFADHIGAGLTMTALGLAILVAAARFGSVPAPRVEPPAAGAQT
ncbi:MFS transporter [Intrasporangium oryzae]|nr:MFS transporter [Intrasporangium oryzae]